MARSDLANRAISFAALWVLVLGVVLTRWETGFVVGIIGMGTLALWEFFCALENKGIRAFKRSGTVCGTFFLIGSWLIHSGRVQWVPQPLFELCCLLAFFLGVMSRLVFDPRRETPVVSMAVTILAVLYVPWLLSFVIPILYYEGNFDKGSVLLIYLLAVTKTADAAAYLTGFLFGKHKMIPSVSPKKTWEGFVGGLLFSMLVSAGIVHAFPDSLSPITPNWSLALGAIIALVSVVGDLAESVVKRDTEIKDSGAFIPGIGGALDLLDSVLFTAPILYLFLQFHA